MKNLKNEVKDIYFYLKSWKGEKQLEYMLEKLSSYWGELNILDKESKCEILREGMVLNKKSYLNVIAKNLNMKLTDADIKLWKNLENCDDNSFAIDLMKKQVNWMEYDEQYFFEQALLHSRKYYISYSEKINLDNLLSVFKEKLDVNFLLTIEKNTNLSMWSYFINKHSVWGDCLTKVLNIKPNWLDVDPYNLINNNQSKINEHGVDWNRINKGLEEYSEKSKTIIRSVLDITIFQKIDGKYIFESNNINTNLMAEMWLLRKEHFDLNIFKSEEKEKLLEKLLNDKHSFISIVSKNNEGMFINNIINSSLCDDQINWKNINLNENAWHALKVANLDAVVSNNFLRSDLENNLEKNNIIHKKIKI